MRAPITMVRPGDVFSWANHYCDVGRVMPDGRRRPGRHLWVRVENEDERRLHYFDNEWVSGVHPRPYLRTSQWLQHWNDAGEGFGHINHRPCTDQCRPYDHFRVFADAPPLSWEPGFDASEWECAGCSRLRYDGGSET
jgi:hypothetical protein